MKRFPWIHQRKKTEPEVPYEPPIEFGNKSNGEFFMEQTAQDRRIRKEILRRCDDNARRVGVDRRDFITSAMGMATTLSVINMASGCGSNDDGTTGGAGGGTGGGVDGGGDGGGYDVPPDATMDCAVATDILSGDEFILDLQTHHIEDETVWRENHPGAQWTGGGFAAIWPGSICDLSDPAGASDADCVGPQGYLDQVILGSDVHVAVLSGFPSELCSDTGTMCNNLLDNDGMVLTRDRVNAAAGSQRMVQHCQVAPNDQWPLTAALMERIRGDHGNNGWKTYPPWGPGGGWWMDSDDIAAPFYEKCLELGENLVCAHKGFPLPGFNPETADPKDVGPAAVKFPGMNFVIYHSAIDSAFLPEGPYDPSNLVGVNRLVHTVIENDLKGKNVYAEMGAAWRIVMADVDSATHYLGKLLKHLGEDNVVFGSECTWFGSPQPQIEALRAFAPNQQIVDQEGYPELTSAVKAKILGLNAAPLYGIDPEATRCAVDQDRIAMAKRELDGELGGRRWMGRGMNGPRTRREFMQLQRWRKFLGVPA